MPDWDVTLWRNVQHDGYCPSAFTVRVSHLYLFKHHDAVRMAINVMKRQLRFSVVALPTVRDFANGRLHISFVKDLGYGITRAISAADAAQQIHTHGYPTVYWTKPITAVKLKAPARHVRV